jgi:hypothetical protein
LPWEVCGGGEEGADVDAEGDDLRDRDARDIDDVAAVELCHGRRLAGLADQRLEVGAGDVPEAEGGDVAVPSVITFGVSSNAPSDERT